MGFNYNVYISSHFEVICCYFSYTPTNVYETEAVKNSIDYFVFEDYVRDALAKRSSLKFGEAAF